MPTKARAVAIRRGGADENEFSEYLLGTTLGSYARNRSLIRLGRDASFWASSNEPTLPRLAVFLHEYLHFIHNYSTVVGIYDFFVQLRLVRLYCSTVDSEGRSHGESVLPPEAQKEACNVLEWRRHLRGSVERAALTALRREKSHPPFVRIQRSTLRLRIGPQSLEAQGVTAIFDTSKFGTGVASVDVQLGGDILMEACAVEAECLLYERCGAPAGSLRAQLPVYPYLTARAVFEGIAGFNPSSEFFCRICVLALQSTDPGDAFIQLAEACKTAGADADEGYLIRTFLLRSKVSFQKAVDSILELGLQKEVEPFAVRGPAGRGLHRMASWADALLKMRLNDAFFELGPVEATPDLDSLVSMLRSLPTCPVVQEVDTDTDTEEFLYFSDVEIPPELTGEIGSAQALFHLTDAHIVTGKFSKTPPDTDRACPFSKACRAPLATTNPEICERRPWESFNPKADECCWYGAGVACSRGRSDL